MLSVVRQNRDWPKQVVVYRVVNGQKRGILFECCLNAFGHCPRCSECANCSVMTGKGRCKNKACLDSEMCVPHLRAYYNVVIKASKIPNGGLGLFAVRKLRKSTTSRRHEKVFKAGDFIAPYGGVRMTPDEFNALYDFHFQRKKIVNTGPYALTADDGSVIDGMCVRRVGAYANDFRGSDEKEPNAVLTEDGLEARKDIYAGDEIYLDYGDSYWSAQKNLQIDQRPIRPDPKVRQTGPKGLVVKY